jgi:hypothetical protein
MITENPQPISCFISTKNEITFDHAALLAQVPRANPRTALTALMVTTHHVSQRHRPIYGAALSAPGFKNLIGEPSLSPSLEQDDPRYGNCARLDRRQLAGRYR